jgi:hypothetical protein
MQLTEIITTLPTEVAAGVLNYLSSDELLDIKPTRLPANFSEAIQSRRLWSQKLMHISSASDLRRMLQNIDRTQHVRRLSFANCQIEPKAILKAIDGALSLEYLSLENVSEIDDELIQTVLLKHGATLRYLNLANCQYLTNYTLAQVARWCTKLVTLTVSGCSFSSSGLEIIAESESLVSSLRSLNISRCYLLDQGAIQPLARLRGLKKLALCHLEWINATNIPHLVSSANCIQEIDIRNCDDFTKAGIDQMRASLPRCVCILENAKLQDDSTDAIRGYLMALVNSTLQC